MIILIFVVFHGGFIGMNGIFDDDSEENSPTWKFPSLNVDLALENGYCQPWRSMGKPFGEEPWDTGETKGEINGGFHKWATQ